jgi:acyl carrier protein phosphodiesterase
LNFLAHIHLSGPNQWIQTGNFMADTVRGKDYLQHPIEIQKGILLHRAIDTFTDAHPLFRSSTKRLHAKYHHYSGVIVDIFYDHFLAKNFHDYSESSLADFTQNFYRFLENHTEALTEKTQHMLPYMVQQDWLFNYQYTEGIARILGQMDRRIQRGTHMQDAVQELQEFYPEFEQEFRQFYHEVQLFSTQKLQELCLLYPNL